MYVLEEPASRQAVDSSLKCEPCASTKSNGLLVFEATAAPLISTTSSVLHIAKLILFHLTKPKKGKKLLSLLILLPMQDFAVSLS